MPASCGPAMVPARMATKVPISTSALPPTSSEGFRICGRMPYLIGPKIVDCRPSRNSTNSNRGTLSSQNPSVASSMITTSNSFTRWICTDFSYLSAN